MSTTERATRIVGGLMSRWDLDGRPDVEGGIDAHLVSALDENGLLAPRARLRAFATECVEHGDMTVAAARMLNRILDDE